MIRILPLLMVCSIGVIAQNEAPKLHLAPEPKLPRQQAPRKDDAQAAAARVVPIGLTDYAGMVDGSKPVHFTFVGQADGRISGSYFLLNDLTPLRFEGKAIDATSFSARVDVAKSDAAASPYLYLKVSASSEGESLMGALYGENGAHQHSLALRLQSANSSLTAEADRYAVAGATDATVIDANAQRFIQTAESGQPARMPALISFPLAYTNNGKRALIHTPAELETHYAAIFTPAFLTTLKNDTPRAMAANAQGIMLGKGDVWFDSSGKVIALNNGPVRMFTGKKFLTNAGWPHAASHSTATSTMINGSIHGKATRAGRRHQQRRSRKRRAGQ